MRCDNRGQALAECCLATLLATGLFLGIAAWAKAEWQRTRCVYQVFQAVHRVREGGFAFFPQVTVSELGDRFHGEARCGEAFEKLDLPKLENARW